MRHGAPRRARSHGAAWGSGAATVCRPARRVRRGATLRTEPAEVRDPMGRAAGSGHELANRSTQARMRKRGGGRARREPHDAQPCGDRRTRLFSVISVSLWPPLRSSASLPRLCRVLVWLRLCRAGPQSHREHGEETAPWRSGGVNDYERGKRKEEEGRRKTATRRTKNENEEPGEQGGARRKRPDGPAFALRATARQARRPCLREGERIQKKKQPAPSRGPAALESVGATSSPRRASGSAAVRAATAACSTGAGPVP